MIELSPRLQTAADLVPPCRCMADIGTDHAYVPLYLWQHGRIRQAVASDIHEGPAARAEEHCRKAQALQAVSVRVGPGLSTLRPGEAEGAVIAGMGGLMIRRILEEGRDVADAMDWFVLQPQNHGAELRRWLGQNGFQICGESLAAEDRMLYEILFVRHGPMPELTELEAETGLLQYRMEDPLFPEFLRRLIRKREFTIRGVAEDTENRVNREKRLRAEREKKELEALLWKFGQKTSSV